MMGTERQTNADSSKGHGAYIFGWVLRNPLLKNVSSTDLQCPRWGRAALDKRCAAANLDLIGLRKVDGIPTQIIGVENVEHIRA